VIRRKRMRRRRKRNGSRLNKKVEGERTVERRRRK
jgi:hypothetical protein